MKNASRNARVSGSTASVFVTDRVGCNARRRRRSGNRDASNTVAKVISTRAAATRVGKSIKQRARDAGFIPGEANINAREGDRRRDLSYIAENSGEAQHEHSINGVPATAAVTCSRSAPFPRARTNHAGEINAWTPAAMRMPNRRAGHTICRYFTE